MFYGDIPLLRGHCVMRGQPTPEGSLCPELQSLLEETFQPSRGHIVFQEEEMKSLRLLHRVVIKPSGLWVATKQREGTCAYSGQKVLQWQLHDSCAVALHHKHKGLPPGEFRCSKGAGDVVTPVMTASREYINSLGKAWHCLVPMQDRSIGTSFFQAQGIGL